jgi:hypothetical protein
MLSQQRNAGCREAHGARRALLRTRLPSRSAPSPTLPPPGDAPEDVEAALLSASDLAAPTCCAMALASRVRLSCPPPLL